MLGVFLNGEEIARPTTTRRARSYDDSFLLLFNARHEDVDVHAAQRALRQALGAASCDTADPEAEPGAPRSHARGDGAVRVALDARCCAARR